MKKYIVVVFLLGLFYVSCGEKKVAKEEKMNQQATVCYQAIDGKDTAWLNLDTSKHKILGTAKFSYANGKIYDGQIKGVISGDTLKGHYDFKVNNEDKWNRNPVAFLQKEGKLTMGVGQFMLIMGSAHFDSRVPIDYDKGRFVFEKINCTVNLK